MNNEYTEPKKKKTVEEISTDLQELTRRSFDRLVELKKIYEQLKLEFPEI
jgi:hypothetical protein